MCRLGVAVFAAVKQCGAQCDELIARRCVGVSPGAASLGIGGRPTRLIGRQITLAAKYRPADKSWSNNFLCTKWKQGNPLFTRLDSLRIPK